MSTTAEARKLSQAKRAALLAAFHKAVSDRAAGIELDPEFVVETVEAAIPYLDIPDDRDRIEFAYTAFDNAVATEERRRELRASLAEEPDLKLKARKAHIDLEAKRVKLAAMIEKAKEEIADLETANHRLMSRINGLSQARAELLRIAPSEFQDRRLELLNTRAQMLSNRESAKTAYDIDRANRESLERKIAADPKSSSMPDWERSLATAKRYETASSESYDALVRSIEALDAELNGLKESVITG